MKNPIIVLISTTSLILLASCGGGSGAANPQPGSGIAPADAYPVGLAVSSPTSVVSSSSAVVASLKIPFQQRLGDWLDGVRQGLLQGNSAAFARLINSLLPMGTAQAAPLKVPEGINVSNYIQRILSGSVTPDISVLPLNGFLKSYTPADCYGPQVAYSRHDDSNTDPKQSGNLPTGDVGMWLDRNGDPITGTPCAAAQLNALMDPIKSRANASLMLGARMAVLASAGTGLPSASSSTEVTTAFQAFVDSLLPSGTTANVTLAGITNNGADSFTYQWRVAFTQGAKTLWLVVRLTHQKTSSGFAGVLQYGVSDLASNTQATPNCASSKKIAVAGTLRYIKNAANSIDFSSREAPYCITGANDLITNFGTWVSLDPNGELDPTKTTATNSSGWHQDGGGFKRFAASMNPDTGAGDYLFAWQAGIGDSHSRMFAVDAAYNSSSEARDLKAFFGFAPNMSTTANPGRLGPLICNWAGPGNSHNPTHTLFQSQSLSLTSSAADWNFTTDALTDSKIRFAPTNSCNSTEDMNFDIDAGSTTGGTVTLDEGASTTNRLDNIVGPHTSVYEEVSSRGFSIPSLY